MQRARRVQRISFAQPSVRQASRRWLVAPGRSHVLFSSMTAAAIPAHGGYAEGWTVDGPS
ncbi:hypothetical protein DK427_12065 [Methylobacterium radiodurans]|uniref:Uncharacterized protein n=1 Tax=Methylobacterium radiodurans TaxID=2202828 RepID=A0A2U8VSE2_9HYPH|nr:hypothetical protein DK427_12065 [Methylobacterium radiodurans]